MLTKEQVKEFCKEHKKEILIVCGTVGGSAILGKALKGNGPKLNYGVTMKTDNKAFAESLTNLINWGSKVPTDGVYLRWGATAEEISESFSEYVAEDEGKYLYSMVLERIDKNKLK